ncbi:hypothetical protein DFH05DRAFT_1498402 [Lentinula detonsa]|uniref:Uncharacterized protein n=1 Tax=Lentinula detonsa TaxID=2804962 RepID=A0A9W8NXQ6_9AGAR|nr:hypothetical protein DFH05DRAFT_1498402 [Lentinula detonsa]
MPSPHTSHPSPLFYPSLDYSPEDPPDSICTSKGSRSNRIAVNVAVVRNDLSRTDANSDVLAVSSSLNLRGSRFQSLSWRLGHFDYLLDALNELRSEFFTTSQHLLPDNEFRLSASRIMDLLQIAKDTLEEVGVDLWPHSLCVIGLRRHKKAYFVLLKLLKSRADSLNDQLQARSRRFTCRLSTNFSIRVNPAYDLYLPPRPRNSRDQNSNCQQLQKNKLCRNMPPPDAFPPSDFLPVYSQSFLDPQRCRRRMRFGLSSDKWESLGLEPPSRSAAPSIAVHNTQSSLGSRRPGSFGTMKRRFGIFCMGKSGAMASNMSRVPASGI